MPSKKFTKICGVCGEKAIGYNFCAVSCESCKAFFRRNASKLNEYKCHFDDNCKIDLVSRKFCRKCRLKKCFAIGMKQEWILNEEEREMRRIKIEENRKWKQSSSSDITTDNPIESNSNCSSMTETFSSDTNNSHELIETDDYSDIISEEEIITNIMEIENYMKSDVDMDSISDDVYKQVVEFELSVIPIARPMSESNLNELECNHLIELLNGSVRRRQIPENTVVANTLNDVIRFFIDKTEQAVQKLVEVSKGLSTFQSMCDNDQIALIKYGVIEIVDMRSALYYNYETECWTLVWDENTSLILKLDLLKQCRRDVYSVYKSYLRKIGKEWDSDPFILDLLAAILLFSPERPNVIHRELVKLQQHIYMHLLQRYLHIRYGSECESKAKFLRIMNVLQDLHNLNEIHRQGFSSEKDTVLFGPLFCEIFDISPNNMLTMA